MALEMFPWYPLMMLVLALTFLKICFRKRETAKKIILPPVTSFLSPKEMSPRDGGIPTGSLHCYVGPMFSGKTSTMIERVVRYADITMSSPPLIINHSLDKDRVVGNGKLGLGVSSHSSQMMGISQRVVTIYTSRLSDVDVSQYNVLGIDETSHFGDLYDTVVLWLSQGKHIYCAGLDGNFLAHNFGEIHRLLPIADTFTKMRAVCHLCQQDFISSGKVVTPDSFVAAPFTSKIGGNMSLEVEVGGQDKYVPTCRYHFLELQKNSSST